MTLLKWDTGCHGKEAGGTVSQEAQIKQAVNDVWLDFRSCNCSGQAFCQLIACPGFCNFSQDRFCYGKNILSVYFFCLSCSFFTVLCVSLYILHCTWLTHCHIPRSSKFGRFTAKFYSEDIFKEIRYSVQNFTWITLILLKLYFWRLNRVINFSLQGDNWSKNKNCIGFDLFMEQKKMLKTSLEIWITTEPMTRKCYCFIKYKKCIIFWMQISFVITLAY